MKILWLSENRGLLITTIAIVMLGLVSGHWLISFLIPLLAYIGWIFYRLYKLERWLARGTKASEVYDDSGFIGQIIRHLYHQKKVHNKRKKRTKEILRRLNRNISALPDATILLNEQMEIEWSNIHARYLLGIHPKRDIGQRISNLIRHPKFLCYLIAPDKKTYIDIQSPLDGNVTLQIKIVRFGDNQRLITARNVTDEKQLQEGLKNFIANASHELKTPLTVIAGHLEMLENDKGLSELGRHSVEVAQVQAERMKDLIQDLLLLSQVESYQLQPHEGDALAIGDIMANTMAAVDRKCNDGGISCDIPPGMRLLGVKAEIEGICINLVENAIKYSPPDTPIVISWKENNQDEYVFSVTDEGPGIHEKELPLLTQRYYRGSRHQAEQIHGSGLGLSIVQQAATKHGAILNIKSKPGKGSCFSVTFPSYRVIRDDNDQSGSSIIDFPIAG
jgi:two-component system phosphate regulon sensor histidine kinase PhoR